jgi:hypothetical protein
MGDGKERRRRRAEEVAGADGHADGAGGPEARRGGQAPHVPALPDDGPSPEKTDARDDLGGDPGRVELEAASSERRPRERLEAVGRDEREQGRTQAEQDVCPEPGRLVTYLPLETDGSAQQRCQHKT